MRKRDVYDLITFQARVKVDAASAVAVRASHRSVHFYSVH